MYSIYQEAGTSPCEVLLRQWQAKRETANYYMKALLRLSLEDPNAYQKRQELNQRIFEAQLAYRSASDQLQRCCQEHGEL